MEVKQFYGANCRRSGRHLRFVVSQAVPDDGNVSDVGDVSDEEEGNININILCKWRRVFIFVL